LDASVQLLTEAAALLKRTLHPRPTGLESDSSSDSSCLRIAW